MSADDFSGLFIRMKPFLQKGILHKLYLRELTSDEINDILITKSVHSGNTLPLDLNFLKLSADTKLNFDMPRNVKFILLAAYLASHNPAKSDQRIFSHVNTRGGKVNVDKVAFLL